jgi:predicted ribosome quality control (RQC) complex YloA/Tae2 family protein
LVRSHKNESSGRLDKPNFWKLDEETLRRSWEEAGRPTLAPWLKNEFWGIDPELAEFLARAGVEAFQKWRELKKEMGEKGWSRFVVQSGPPPSLFTLKEPDAPKGEIQIFSTANKALERLFQLENHFRDFSHSRSKLESEVAKALKHEKRILEKLKKDRAEAERSDQYQWWGELLMALLHKVKPHLPQIDLEDVVRGTKTVVTVPLDPESTPLQNAQRFFKKAQKGSRGLAQVEKREGEIKGRLEQLKAAQRSLPALQSSEEIRKAGQDLFPKAQETPAKAGKARIEKVPTPNILRERLNKQFEVCAGTSAAANEYVTFQLAQPEDLWFHVRDLPGSHVVLRRLQRDAPYTDELVLHAARLAASHSKAKPGSKVTVSYTEKKYVKRIPGAPMGMVSMSKERSLLVEV